MSITATTTTTRYKEEVMPSSERTVTLSVAQIDMLMGIIGPIMDRNTGRWGDMTDEERRQSDMLADVENTLFQAGSTMEDN